MISITNYEELRNELKDKIQSFTKKEKYKHWSIRNSFPNDFIVLAKETNDEKEDYICKNEEGQIEIYTIHSDRIEAVIKKTYYLDYQE